MASSLGPAYASHAEAFLSRYAAFMTSQGKSFDHGIDSYMKLCASMNLERALFLRSGEYSSKSFAEVEARVYASPEVMQHHMHGLVFAQFLWPDQYERYRFFCEHLPEYRDRVAAYLEIGGGHALYIAAALEILRSETTFDLVDISPTSMELARGIAQSERINYYLMDIHDFPPDRRYDFITMGEVLEHVEEPLALLKCVRNLLADNGTAYITTPVNAPTLDHIYLFHNIDEIRTLLCEAGFEILREVSRYAEDMPPERARKFRIPQMFGAFVAKRYRGLE
jgi:SAM-dependent methyltransferase